MPSPPPGPGVNLRERLSELAPISPGSLGGRLLPRGSVLGVAMSGGVDSSVAALLAVASGIETVGVTMRLWGSDEMERGEGGCCSIDAVEDARRVCNRLGIPHYVLNLAENFRERVVDDFLDSYASGLTPNPCIRCNERVKFAELLRRVAAVGATHIASGHYARIADRAGGEVSLHRGRDGRKDQSYTLYRSGPEVLRHLVLPLGLLEKSQVRRVAEAAALNVAQKPDSQELCFVGGGDHRDFLAERLEGGFAPGPILSLEGEEMGRHRGLPFYTVGQRQGLGLLSRRSDSAPAYVVRIDRRRNAIFVGPWRCLLRPDCEVRSCLYLGGEPDQLSGLAQVRAHGEPVPARWTPTAPGWARVEFENPQAAVAPGQSLVLYDGDRVTAGGEIAPQEEVEFP